MVMLKGAPPNMSERDVFDFFSDIGLSPINVRILTDPHGGRNGQVLCEFQEPGHARGAIAKDGMYFGRNKILVTLIPRKGGSNGEMRGQPGMRGRPGILGSVPGPGFVPNPRFQNPAQSDNPFVQALNAQPPQHMMGGPGPRGGLRGRGGPRMRGRGGPLGQRPSRFTPADSTTADISHDGDSGRKEIGFFERPGKLPT